MIENLKLRDYCVSIFGDIVKTAYITTYYDETFVCFDNNILSYDAQSFIIEFTNGNKIEFNNSEWASLKKL